MVHPDWEQNGYGDYRVDRLWKTVTTAVRLKIDTTCSVRVSLSVINTTDSLYFLKNTAASLIQKTCDVKQVLGKHVRDGIL